jgi:hypothetical protein
MNLERMFSSALEWLSEPLGAGLAVFLLIFGGLSFWAFSNVAIWEDAEDNIGNEAFWITLVLFVPFVGIPLYAAVRLLLIGHVMVTDLCDQGYRKFIGGGKMTRFGPVGSPMNQQIRYSIYRQGGGGRTGNNRPDLMAGPRTLGTQRPDADHKPFQGTMAGEKGTLLRETRARASRGEPIELAVLNHNFLPKDHKPLKAPVSSSSPFDISRNEHQKMSWRARMRDLRSERITASKRRLKG